MPGQPPISAPCLGYYDDVRPRFGSWLICRPRYVKSIRFDDAAADTECRSIARAALISNRITMLSFRARLHGTGRQRRLGRLPRRAVSWISFPYLYCKMAYVAPHRSICYGRSAPPSMSCFICSLKILVLERERVLYSTMSLPRLPFIDKSAGRTSPPASRSPRELVRPPCRRRDS